MPVAGRAIDKPDVPVWAIFVGFPAATDRANVNILESDSGGPRPGQQEELLRIAFYFVTNEEVWFDVRAGRWLVVAK